MTRLRLPRPEAPELSIVLVTYGAGDWAVRALRAVEAATDPIYEVLVIDNASPDGAADLLEASVDGMRLVRNERNEGFAAAADRGAKAASGRLLCFLNPDALVAPGWLEPLAGALQRPGIGAAVPRFLDPDGAVQEAGSVVDRQGWTEALGAGADPSDPATRFPRVVDYGSAACLVLTRDAYERTGGFDPAYHPAYCEDVDLAFALRAGGLHTLYVPGVDVTHAGAVSSGEATRVELIERNRPRLLERWGRELAWRPPLGELDVHPHRLLALRDALLPERLLHLAPAVPPQGDPVSRLLVDLSLTNPAVRFTVAAEGASDAEHLLAAGIEVAAGVDIAAWLEERRFHHSAILADGAAWGRWGDAVRRSQPQAVRLGLGEVDGAHGAVLLGAEASPGPAAFAPADPRERERLLSWLGVARRAS